MRTRVLLASLALVAVVVVGSSAPAFAASTAAKAPAAATVASASKPDKDTQECKKILDEGKSLDTCQQAPSPILPPMNELVWGIISFVAVVLLLWKFAWPGIKTGMEGRTQKIAKDLEEAEAQRTGAEGILAEYKAQLADAKTESARIIDEARQSAEAMRKDLEARAAADIAELRTRAAS
ncbi:MAG TPA: ATP synthase F0 subunit B, partial [Acidimicrobiales bacterium]